MRADLGRLRVDKVIVHDVPTRPVRGGGLPLVLSEVESPLTQELKNYFREKITATLTTAGYDVVFDPTSPSPIPALVLDNLGSQTTVFVSMSQQIAQHLYSAQTGVNPAGLLCVAQVSVGTVPGLTILKLEREAGVRLQQTLLGGKATYSLEHLRELMLTEKTKVFKVGLFIQRSSALDTIEGGVSDNQRGYHPTTEVADFFLKRFLGCKLREASGVTTKRLFLATETFISEQVNEPETKARYEIALLAELSSQSRTFSPIGFAERYLLVQDSQRYIDWLGQAEISPQPFDKDISLINTHLKRIQLDFESGIAVLGDPEVFQEHVKMRDLDDGRTRVEIEDRVRRVQGKR
ncbi:MAG: nucleoid-associated protein [Chloroflexota bacterium]|nr:nucleoid-associated protein [Chloroflexota bacterium]